MTGRRGLSARMGRERRRAWLLPGRIDDLSKVHSAGFISLRKPGSIPGRAFCYGDVDSETCSHHQRASSQELTGESRCGQREQCGKQVRFLPVALGHASQDGRGVMDRRRNPRMPGRKRRDKMTTRSR